MFINNVQNNNRNYTSIVYIFIVHSRIRTFSGIKR